MQPGFHAEIPISRLNIAALNSKLSPTNRRFYTDADIDAVICAVRPTKLPTKRIIIHRPDDVGLNLIKVALPPRVALSERLEVAAQSFDFDDELQKSPAPSKIAKHLSATARNAEALHRALSLPQSGDPLMIQKVRTKIAIASQLETVGHRQDTGYEALDDAVQGIRSVARWAKAAELKIRSQMKRSPTTRNRGDWARNEWLFLLAEVWREVFGLEPSTSVGAPGQPNEGEASGPFIRFISAANEPLDIKLSGDAIRARLRRLGLSN